MGQTESKPVINKTDKAIFKLKLQRDNLLKYNKSLNLLINNDLEKIKYNLKSQNKSKAMTYLKRKKFHEELLNKTLLQIDSLENLINSIQIKLIEKEFLDNIQSSTKILKVLNEQCNADKLDKIMDESEDQIMIQRQIDDVISSGIVKIDSDEEIDEELSKLEKEITKQEGSLVLEDAPRVDKLPIYPQVDTGAINEEVKREEKQKAGDLLA